MLLRINTKVLVTISIYVFLGSCGLTGRKEYPKSDALQGTNSQSQEIGEKTTAQAEGSSTETSSTPIADASPADLEKTVGTPDSEEDFGISKNAKPGIVAGRYQFKSPDGKLCLELNSAKKAKLRDCRKNDYRQLWDVVKVTNDTFKIINVRTALALSKPLTNKAITVGIRGYTNAAAGKWRFKKMPGGKYQISSTSKNKYLLPKYGKSSDGPSVTSDYNTSRWALKTIFVNDLNKSMVDPKTPKTAKPAVKLPGGHELVFSDEFSGTKVDKSKWNIDNSKKSRAARKDLGIKQWFWKPANVSVKNNVLVLEVSKDSNDTMHCGSINSNNKFEKAYGYYETRIKIAEAKKGTHTAFWFQGDKQGLIDSTANDGAEIDVFESAWTKDFTKSVLHIDGYGKSHRANTKKYNTPGIHKGFHTYSVYWSRNGIYIYYDGKLSTSYKEPDWQVHDPEYIWLSDGASFGIKGDNFTKLKKGNLTQAYVDYVRVWRSQKS